MFFHILNPLLVAAAVVFSFSCAFALLFGGHFKRVKNLKNQTNKK